MNWWFIGYLGLMVMGLGISLAKHGESKENEKYNFWASLVSFGIVLSIMYMAIKTGF